MSSLDALKARLSAATALRPTGKVLAVTGLSLRCSLPGVRVGDVVHVERRGEPLACEVVGFDRGEAVAMPLGALTGVGADDEVESTGAGFLVSAAPSLLGRVVDGLGRPIDGKGAIEGGTLVPVDADPPLALERRPVTRPLATGVRVLDGLLTLGEGQRVGLFAGSGVGKSTLLGAIARGAAADVVVVGLVGERGREVGEFLEHALGAEGLARSVVVVATSDVAALERLRAAQVATAYAEYFRDHGKSVMLLVDSVTRFARAQREVGLAAGEPPARRGYPPSVFAMLPRLLERSGQGSTRRDHGHLHGPRRRRRHGRADRGRGARHSRRSRRDGPHDRSARRYPAVDPTVSLSRVMDAIVTPEHRDAARKLRALVAHYEAKRDLVMLGAYAKGSDKELDDAIARMPKIEQFLRQSPTDRVPFDETAVMLARVVS